MTLNEVLDGELEGWRGLPRRDVAELSQSVGPVRGVRAPAEAVRASRRFQVSVIERTETPHEVEAWVEVGARHVAFVEYDDPGVVSLERTLESLGAPDLTLADRRFVDDATVRDYVFARRGITVSIAEPFDGVRRPRQAIHVLLFPATTPETYLTDIDRGTESSPKTHPEAESDTP
jgi:hypothetical protein